MWIFGRKISEGFFSLSDKKYSAIWSIEKIPHGFVIKGHIRGKPENLEILRIDAPRRVLAGGWQSWSPFKVIDTRNHSFKTRNWKYKDTPAPSENHLSDYLIAFDGVVIGFLSSRFAHPYFEIDGDQIVAYLNYFNSNFEDEIPIEPLIVLNKADTPLLLELYARMVAKENSVKLEKRKPIGWSSWYQYFSDLEWSDVLMNLEKAGDFPIEVFQIDDAYETDIGDWLDTKAGFPDVSDMAEVIKRKGFKPGIWVAPFSVSETSKLFKEHPDWVVKENGKPKIAYKNWEKDIYALDLSSEEVLNWLNDLFSNLRKMGYRFFKIDFLFSGAIPGERKRPESPIISYRRGMRVIREATKDAFILGCGAPLVPSTGFVDGMRVSEDTAPYWEAKDEGISAKYALRNDITRYFFNKRLWHNDPDCLILRKETNISKEQREIYAITSGTLDNMLFLSDDLRKLSESEKDLLEKAISLSGGKPRVENIMDGSMKYEITSKGSRAGNIHLVVDLEESKYKLNFDNHSKIDRRVMVKNDGRNFYFYGEVF